MIPIKDHLMLYYLGAHPFRMGLLLFSWPTCSPCLSFFVSKCINLPFIVAFLYKNEEIFKILHHFFRFLRKFQKKSVSLQSLFVYCV